MRREEEGGKEGGRGRMKNSTIVIACVGVIGDIHHVTSGDIDHVTDYMGSCDQ